MSQASNSFPWGVWLGELRADSGESLPALLSVDAGGLYVRYDQTSEAGADKLIENIALKLFEILPPRLLYVDVFDFSHRKRFMHLAGLQANGLYRIALSAQAAAQHFDELETLALERHHQRLSPQYPTLSSYNQHHPRPEPYRLLIINLAHYPDDTALAPHRRLQEFFAHSLAAGFYLIAFAGPTVVESRNPTVEWLRRRLLFLGLHGGQLSFSEQCLPYPALQQQYRFEPVNENRLQILQTLQDKLAREQPEDRRQPDFLSVPIATTLDGQHAMHFRLGEQAGNHHAFIIGTTGSGKTTLLNNLILGIARQYTAAQVRLYLMDYKRGTEFQVFDRHPNVEKIFLDNDDLQAAVDLFADFYATIDQRGQLFRAQGVKDIDAHNSANPGTPLPRLLLIIDEVQRLLDGNWQSFSRFNALLAHVVREGRSFGVHLILSTQTPQGTNLDDAILSEIGLRIAMKVGQPQALYKLFGHDNAAPLRLRAEHFELVYNPGFGRSDANKLGCALPPPDIRAEIERIRAARSPQQMLMPEVMRSCPAQPASVSRVTSASVAQPGWLNPGQTDS